MVIIFVAMGLSQGVGTWALFSLVRLPRLPTASRTLSPRPVMQLGEMIHEESDQHGEYIPIPVQTLGGSDGDTDMLNPDMRLAERYIQIFSYNTASLKT